MLHSELAVSRKVAKRSGQPSRFSRWLVWIDSHAVLLAVLLTLIASARIVSTYAVFNHTVDEPAHIGCGMEWLGHHTYTLEPQHPPLARVLTALGPYIAGRRWQKRDVSFLEGLAVLYEEGHYDRNLALARLGILPFFWLACAVVFEWARRGFGRRCAVFALLLFSTTPPLLAHAGLATTDMALTATLGAAFVAFIVWMDSPGWTQTIMLGVCGGLLVLSKFSSLVFFPAVVIGALLLYWRAGWRPSWTTAARLATAFAVAFVIVWAGYRFSLAELFAGIRQLMQHNAAGHPSYLLGERSMSGFWYYYPVVLAVKTPIAFAALSIFGMIVCLTRGKGIQYVLPVIFAAAILIVALFSNINIGVRHVLPVYIALSIIGAAGVVELADKATRQRWAGWFLAITGVWMILGSALSHPDYLGYTNLLAGDEPEKVLADSDLDWGQDMTRLAARLRERGAPFVYFDPLVIADLQKWHGFPPVVADRADVPRPGYHAVSITVWKVMRMRLFDTHPEIQPWPDRFKPVERVGKGVLLYYFPGG